MQEGTADASVVGVKRVNELGYYSLRFADLARKLDITTNQVTALTSLLEIKSDEDCCMRIINTWCYSQEALPRCVPLWKPGRRWNGGRCTESGISSA